MSFPDPNAKRYRRRSAERAVELYAVVPKWMCEVCGGRNDCPTCEARKEFPLALPEDCGVKVSFGIAGTADLVVLWESHVGVSSFVVGSAPWVS